MIEHVADHADPRLGDYAHVGDHAWLLERGLFVAEGRLVVQRLFASGRYLVKSVLVTPAALAAIEASLPAGSPAFVADQSIVNGVTGFNFHRGCLALAGRPADDSVVPLLSAGRLLAFEGVGNPDNVGGLFRVAAAFGVDGVLLDATSADPFYRKALRTSMGAVLSVPLARVDWPSALNQLRDAGFTIVALTPAADAQPLERFAANPPDRIVVIVGAEGPGLTAAALAAADVRVRIPIASAVDSLNVVVSAGIALSRLSTLTRLP